MREPLRKLTPDETSEIPFKQIYLRVNVQYDVDSDSYKIVDEELYGSRVVAESSLIVKDEQTEGGDREEERLGKAECSGQELLEESLVSLVETVSSEMNKMFVAIKKVYEEYRERR